MHALILAAIEHPAWDPVLFRIGPLALHWYGIAYILAFVISIWLLKRMIRRGYLRITDEQLSSLIGWLVIGVLAGGRLGWWLVYDRTTDQPWYQPLAIWTGGMSFHGGLVGVLLVLMIWSRLRRISFLHVADALAIVAPIGLFMGRLANFINAELVGRPSGLPWAVIFPGDAVGRHPSQLYEAVLEGPVLLLLVWLTSKRKAAGLCSAAFLIFYGLFRFVVEFTREPDAQIGFVAFGWLTMGQVLSLLTSLAGAGLLLYVWPGRGRTDSLTPR